MKGWCRDQEAQFRAEKEKTPAGLLRGRSGNAKGRPRFSSRAAKSDVFEVLVEKTLTVTNDGQDPRDRVEEALQLRTFQDALAGRRWPCARW